jgi:hypothetical protein
MLCSNSPGGAHVFGLAVSDVQPQLNYNSTCAVYSVFVVGCKLEPRSASCMLAFRYLAVLRPDQSTATVHHQSTLNQQYLSAFLLQSLRCACRRSSRLLRSRLRALSAPCARSPPSTR